MCLGRFGINNQNPQNHHQQQYSSQQGQNYHSKNNWNDNGKNDGGKRNKGKGKGGGAGEFSNMPGTAAPSAGNASKSSNDMSRNPNSHQQQQYTLLQRPSEEERYNYNSSPVDQPLQSGAGEHIDEPPRSTERDGDTDQMTQRKSSKSDFYSTFGFIQLLAFFSIVRNNSY